jgi:hypothetical protein
MVSMAKLLLHRDLITLSNLLLSNLSSSEKVLNESLSHFPVPKSVSLILRQQNQKDSGSMSAVPKPVNSSHRYFFYKVALSDLLIRPT